MKKYIILLVLILAAGGWLFLLGLQKHLESRELELSTMQWKSSSSPESPKFAPNLAHDGDSLTRWHTNRSQKIGDWYQLDLGSPQRVSKIILDSGEHRKDYPRSFHLFISQDNERFYKVAISVTADNGLSNIRLNTPQLCRYLKIVLNESVNNWFWGIEEIRVYTLPEDSLPWLTGALTYLKPGLLLIAVAALILLAIAGGVHLLLMEVVSKIVRAMRNSFSTAKRQLEAASKPMRRLSSPVAQKIRCSRFTCVYCFIALNVVLVPLFLWSFLNNYIQLRMVREGETLSVFVDGHRLIHNSIHHRHPVAIRFKPPILRLRPQALSDIIVRDPATDLLLYPRKGGTRPDQNPWPLALRRGLRSGPPSTDFSVIPNNLDDFELTFRLWNPIGMQLIFTDQQTRKASKVLVSLRNNSATLECPNHPNVRSVYRPTPMRYASLILFRLTMPMIVGELVVIALILISYMVLFLVRILRNRPLPGRVIILAVLGAVIISVICKYSGISASIRNLFVQHIPRPLTLLLLLLFLPPLSRRISRRVGAVLFFLAALSFIFYVHYFVFDHFPGFGDEMNYLVQAKIFAHGKLYVPEPENPEFFKVFWQDLFWTDGKIWNFHNMGNSVLLAIGWLFNAPWIIPPIVGATSVLFLYLLSFEIYQDRRTSFLVGVICLSSQFFVSLSGSFMAHSTAACFLTISFYYLIKTTRTSRARHAILAGSSMGFAFITRTLSGVLAGFPFALYGLYKFVTRKLKFRHLVIILIFFALVGSLDCTRMYFTMGKFTLPYWVKGPEAHKNVLSAKHYKITDMLHNSWRNMIELTNRVFGLRYYFNLCFLFLPFILLTRNRWDYLFLFYFLFYSLAHSAVHWYGWKFEPRMLFESFPAIAILTARGMAALLSFPEDFPWFRLSIAPIVPRAIAWVCIALFFTVNFSIDLPYRLQREYKNYCRTSPETRETIARRNIHNAIVFIKGLNFDYAPYVPYNALDCKGDIIYARDLGREKNQKLIAEYPDRRIFYAKTRSNLVEEKNFFTEDISLILKEVRELQDKGYKVILGLPWFRFLKSAYRDQLKHVIPFSANEFDKVIRKIEQQKTGVAFLLVEESTELLPIIQSYFPNGKLASPPQTSGLYKTILYLVKDTIGKPVAKGLRPVGKKPGLLARYYGNHTFKGKPRLVRSELDLTIGNQTPFDESFSVEWNGKIKIERKGNHTFETISDDGSWLYIDDQLVVDNGRGGAARSKTGSIHLEAGYHSIKIKYFQNRGVKEHRVNWKPPGKSKQPITVQRAFNFLSHTR